MQSSPRLAARNATLPLAAEPEAKQKYSTATWLCWLYILLAIGRLSEIIPFLAKIPLSKLVALAWAVAVLSNKERLLKLPAWSLPTMRLGIGLLILAWSSILFSVWRGQSWAFLSSGGIVVPISVTLVLLTSADWPTLRGTLRSLVVSGTLFSALAILGYRGGRVSVGYSFDPNDLGYLLVTVIPLSIAFGLVSRGIYKWINLGITLALAGTVILTQSRGGFLALVFIAIFLVFSPLRLPTKTPADPKQRRKRKGGLATRLTILIVCVGIGWVVTPQEAKERLATVFSLGSDYNMDASNHLGRTSVWKRNLAALGGRPIGFGVSASPMADMLSGGQFIQMHNSVVQIAVELGVLGVLLFLRLYWVALRWTRKAARGDVEHNSPEMLLFAKALSVSVCGNFIAGFFLSQAYSNLLWMVMTLVTALMIQMGVPYGRQPKRPAPRGRVPPPRE